jgi:abortive infection bacteriophage resistance protein
MSTYNKPAINLATQVAKLRDRGLEIADETTAAGTLLNIGYYRFSGYSYPFLKISDREQFKDGTHFDHILRVYEFDRHLRLIVADAVERIEVGIRARIVNETTLDWNPHGYLDSSKFHPRFNHANFIKKAEQAVGIKYDRTTGNRTRP